MNPLSYLLLGATALALAACKSPTTKASAGSAQETRCLTALRSSADLKQKADACRELARWGSAAAVPTLVGLLGDAQLSHMARYALETIPDPAVDRALREAVPTLRGRQRAGVLTSLGVRRDARAVPMLAGYLNDADADVASAAARALGDIGTPAAARALETALPRAAGGQRLAICEGLFRCAERLTAASRGRDALRLYDQLQSLADAPHQVRAGALRGAILGRGHDGLALLEQAICGPDWVLADAAARTAIEMTAANVTRTLTQALDRLAADRRVLVLQVLGCRRDVRALPTLLAAARQGDVASRLAAVRALAQLQSPAAAAPVAELIQDPERPVAEAARECLAALPGEQADAVVLRMLASTDKATRLAALDQVARRRMKQALPVLDQAADSPDPQVRAAALKQLGAFGGEAELARLLNRLDRATASEDISALTDALSTLCPRLAKPDLCADQLVARLATAGPAQQAALLHVLVSVGGAKALAAVRTAAQSPNPPLRTAAVGALTDWATADAAPELLALASKADDPDIKLRCLRRYLRWAADTDVPARQRLDMCKQAASLVERVEEKKLLLAALGGINQPEAVRQIAPFVDDAATREEACVAAVNVTEKFTGGRNPVPLPAALRPVLEKIAGATANADLARRARALLEKKP